MSATGRHQRVPDEIAEAVIRPESYVRLEDIVLPACAWLRANLPIGKADVDGWDPVWLVARHSDMSAIARDQKTFLNGDFPHLPSHATVEFYEQTSRATARSFDYPSYTWTRLSIPCSAHRSWVTSSRRLYARTTTAA
jgi:alpha-terpineol hydroxylase